MRKNVTRLLLTLLLSSVFMLSSVMPAAAIQFGQPDGDNHPYVCVIVFYDKDGARLWRTTGALISPTVVLTAAHGTDGTASAKVWFLSKIPPNPDANPLAYPYGGPDAYAGTPHTNPDYVWRTDSGAPGFDYWDYRDVGIVVLDKPAPVTRYAQLPMAGLVDTFSTMHRIDQVGYGVNYQVHGGGVRPYDAWQWNRERAYAPGRIIETKSVTGSEFLKLTANPAQGKGGTTFGDSGGPILDGGTNVVLGLVSYGADDNCSSVGYAQRVDIPAVLQWIRSYLK